MILIIISGPPATGKTLIAVALEKDTSLVVISKDRIKEQLFDERGIGDKAWSKKLGKESYEIVVKRLHELFMTKQPFILEGNYSGSTADQIRDGARENEYRILQIKCDAPDEFIEERMKKRWESGERHRGHVDDQTLGEQDFGETRAQERHIVFSDELLELDECSSLADNVTKALEFVKRRL